jgi:hypothetical protein
MSGKSYAIFVFTADFRKKRKLLPDAGGDPENGLPCGPRRGEWLTRLYQLRNN